MSKVRRLQQMGTYQCGSNDETLGNNSILPWMDNMYPDLVTGSPNQHLLFEQFPNLHQIMRFVVVQYNRIFHTRGRD